MLYCYYWCVVGLVYVGEIGDVVGFELVFDDVYYCLLVGG